MENEKKTTLLQSHCALLFTIPLLSAPWPAAPTLDICCRTIETFC